VNRSQLKLAEREVGNQPEGIGDRGTCDYEANPRGYQYNPRHEGIIHHYTSLRFVYLPAMIFSPRRVRSSQCGQITDLSRK
jgi:hypothetical protein